MTKRKVTGNLIGQMVDNIKGIGRMVNSMEKGSTQTRKV